MNFRVALQLLFYATINNNIFFVGDTTRGESKWGLLIQLFCFGSNFFATVARKGLYAAYLFYKNLLFFSEKLTKAYIFFFFFFDILFL